MVQTNAFLTRMVRRTSLPVAFAVATFALSAAAHATIISGTAANEVFDVFGGAAPDYAQSLTTFSDSALNGNLNGRTVNLQTTGGSITASLSGQNGGFGNVSIGNGTLTVSSEINPAFATFTLSQPAHYFGFDFRGIVNDSVSFFDTSGQALGSLSILQLSQNVSKLDDGSYFANITSNLPIGSIVFRVSGGGPGATLVLDDISVASVPLPAALPLFGAAVAGLGMIGKRRRNKASA